MCKGNDSSRLGLIGFFLRASIMSKRGPRAVREFTSAAWNQFGMRIVVLVAFLEDGEPAILLWVEGPILLYSCFSQFQTASITTRTAGGRLSGKVLMTGRAP